MSDSFPPQPPPLGERRITGEMEPIKPPGDTIKNTQSIIAIILGLLGIAGILFTFMTKVASHDFITTAQADKRETALIKQINEKLAAERALSDQKQQELLRRVEELANTNRSANKEMSDKLEKLYNFLLSRQR